MRILTIDPGTKRCGYSLWDIANRNYLGLIDCNQVKTKNKDVVLGAFEMAMALPHGVDVVAIEKMRIYRPRPGQNVKKLPNPESLINISIVSGVIAGCVTAKAGRYYFPYATEWGGTLPKGQKNDIIASLVPKAIKIMDKNKVAQSYRNHVLDAVGIGLWTIDKERRIA